jgi:hypothetical protein
MSEFGECRERKKEAFYHEAAVLLVTECTKKINDNLYVYLRFT